MSAEGKCVPGLTTWLLKSAGGKLHTSKNLAKIHYPLLLHLVNSHIINCYVCTPRYWFYIHIFETTLKSI